MEKAIVILGTTDSVTTCDCCGKTNLKRTVVIDDPTAGGARYYGTTCAAKAHAIEASEIRRAAKQADADAIQREWEEKDRAAAAQIDQWLQWLKRNGTGDCSLEQMNSLGGYANARAMYKAELAK